MTPLSVTPLTDTRAFAPLADEWNALVRASGASVYQTPAWVGAWWDHLGRRAGRSLRVLVIRDGAALVAVAPFVHATATFAGVPARRRILLAGSGNAFSVSAGLFLDDGPGDYLDVVVAPGAEHAVAARLAAWMCDEADGADSAEFLNVPPGGFCRTALPEALAAVGVPCRESAADACPRLTMTGDVASFLRSRDAGTRRRLQQAVTAGADGALFTLRRATTEEEALAALDELMRLHQRRWRKLGYPGLFADARSRAFQQAVVRALWRAGHCRVTRADAAGACVAVRLAYAHNGRFYDALTGFDDAAPAAKRRPGLAILLAQMDDAWREGIRTIDFLRGDEAYKFSFTAEAPRNANVIAELPPSARFSLLRGMSAKTSFAAFLAAREARLLDVQLREHVFPASVYHYARFRAGRFVQKFFHANARGDAGTARSTSTHGTAHV